MTCLVFFYDKFHWMGDFQDSTTHQNLWSKCCVLMVHGLFHSMSMAVTANFHPVDSPCFLKELETQPQPRYFSPKQSYDPEMGRFDHQSYSIPKGTWILSEQLHNLSPKPLPFPSSFILSNVQCSRTVSSFPLAWICFEKVPNIFPKWWCKIVMNPMVESGKNITN